VPGAVGHTFTHFHLDIAVLAGRADGKAPGLWVRPDRLSEHALPTLMKKIVRWAQAGLVSRS
jgi:A/G-specific adenine glycosylase